MRKQKTAVCLLLAMTLSMCNMTVYAENVRNRDMEYHEISYDEELMEALESIDFGDTSAVTDNLILPLSFGIHIKIDWQSSDEKIISTDGTVYPPSEKDGDKTVTMTAKLTSTKTDKTQTKAFDITVKALSTEELLEKEAKQVRSFIDYILNTGYELPDKQDIGITSDISWSIKSGNAKIDNNTLFKNEKSAEREPIVLSAVLKQGTSEKEINIENLILLDKYKGYILSFFGGNDDKKTVHLAYSYDGEHFFALNNGETILKTAKKKLKYQELRDPFIMRKKDGSFAILATNGWNSTSIYLWDSDDLTSFTNERTCVLSIKGVVGLSGFHTWAPECNYDPITDKYTVYWSDPEADNKHGKTFFNTSSDLETFSEPGILYETDGSMIDASIKKYKGSYYMVYNDAYGDNETGKGGKIIYMAKSNSLEAGSFRQISGALSPAGTISEGPFLFENFEEKSWYVMYDHYGLHKFGVAKTSELKSDEWDYLGVSNTMPTENIRHGGVVPVTEKELNAIIKAYRKSEPLCSEVLTPEAVTVEKDSQKLSLPKETDIILEDGQKITKSVEWDTSSIDTKNTGNYISTGKITLKTASGEAVSETAIEVKIIEKEHNNLHKIIVGILAVVLVLNAGIVFFIKKKKPSNNEE